MVSKAATMSADELSTIREDLKESVICDVGGFYEKYFENKSWTGAAGELVETFKESPRSQNHENGSTHLSCALQRSTDADAVTWLKTYLKTFPSGLPNTWVASSDQPLDDCDVEEPLPTFYLVHPGAGEQDSSWKWSDVQVLGLVTSSDSDISAYQARMRFFLHARHAFNAQPTRLFIHGFQFHGREGHFWVFDRQGAYASTPLILDRAEDQERFLRAVAGYAMMSREELGMNPYIQNDGESNFVVMKNFANGEDERLYFEDCPIRRYAGISYAGPTWFRAGRLQFEDREFVIKFVWRRAGTHPEGEMTALVTKKKVWGVVQLLGHCELTSIHELRSGLDFEQGRMVDLKEQHYSIDRTAQERTHPSRPETSYDLEFYCVAICPVGRPIQDYKSIQEVLEAFNDAVKALRSLYMDAHILHRDVSPENITISTTKQEGVPRGFLIDLDVAICVDEAQPKGGERHGTRPFMAIGVLRTKKHTYKHDLESLFYCFLWVAICGKGKTWPPQGSKLWAWTQASFRECASHKSAFEEAEGFEYVLDEFTQDFVHCKELARELWRIFFFVGSGHDGNDPDICYQAVLRAFRDAGAEAKSFCQDGQY